jgi:hypothetical protein
MSYIVITLLFPQFALLNSVPYVQFSLTKFLQSCGCVVVASFPDVPLP